MVDLLYFNATDNFLWFFFVLKLIQKIFVYQNKLFLVKLFLVNNNQSQRIIIQNQTILYKKKVLSFLPTSVNFIPHLTKNVIRYLGNTRREHSFKESHSNVKISVIKIIKITEVITWALLTINIKEQNIKSRILWAKSKISTILHWIY